MSPAKLRNASRTLGRRSAMRSAMRGRREQRLAPVLRLLRQRGETGLAEAAARHGDRAEERLVVARVGDQPEIGQQVLDLAPLVEADRADQAIRQAGAAECFLECPRLRIGPVEHRHVGVAPFAGRAPPLELAGHPFGLVPLVRRREQRHRLAAPPPGRERLPDPAACSRRSRRWRRRAPPGWTGSSPPAGPAWRRENP